MVDWVIAITLAVAYVSLVLILRWAYSKACEEEAEDESEQED